MVFKLFTVIFVFALLSLTSTHPAYRKEFDNIVGSNECLRSCMNKVAEFNEEISLMKNPDIQRYFGRLDETCDLIAETRECIDACKISSNPFALESVNVICSPESRQKASRISQCLTGIESNVYETCTNQCGEDYKAINDEVHNLTQTLQEAELKNNEKVNPIMEKTNLACGIFKCVTRCNVDVIGRECGKEAGEELQGLIQDVLNSQHRDVEKLHIASTMAKTIPPQCSYMYDPSIIFGTTGLSIDSQNENQDRNLLEKAQYELVLKQLKLAEKQDALIDRENHKLDIEMELLTQRSEQKKRTYEESSFLFN